MAGYEIYTGSSGRWTLEALVPDRNSAVERGRELYSKGMYDAVKVTDEAREGKSEKVHFLREVGGKHITVSPVDEAPPCETLEDYYRFPARRTVGRLLRKYLDDQGVTAIEVLFGYGYLKLLSRRDQLFHQAVSAVGNLQARAAGRQPQERITELYAVFDKILARAEKLGDNDRYFSILKERGVDALIAACADMTPVRREFFVRAGFAGYIGEEGDWAAKLDRLIKLLDPDPSPEGVRCVDEVIAEVLDGAEATREILGGQSDLASALSTMVSLTTGVPGPDVDPEEILGRLTAAMGGHDLALSTEIVLGRIGAALSGTNSLTREGLETDRAAVGKLMAEMAQPYGLIGGPEICASMTQRARMALKEAGEPDLTDDEGLEAVQRILPDGAARLGFLIDVANSSFGEKHPEATTRALAELIAKASSPDSLGPEGASGDELIRCLTELRGRVASSRIVDAWKPRFAAKMDELIAAAGGAPPATTTESAGETAMADKSMAHVTFASGDYIFREGDPGEEAFLIGEGEVEIIRKHGNMEEVIAKVAKGAIIGEMALIDDQPRIASARCVDRVVATRIPMASFKKRMTRLRQFDPVLRRLMDVFVDRIRVQSRR